ncbi:MAG: hypothetical protein AAGK00_04620 [Pseudomonadota bacterium]
MSFIRPGLAGVLLIGALTITGCARTIDPGTYDGASVGEVVRTYEGTVEQVRQVSVEEGALLEENRTGQLIGGVAGGFIGSLFGGGIGKAAAIAGGSVVGAVAGSLVEEEAKRQPALEYIVRDDQGQLVTVVQGPEPSLAPGQRVYVQEGYSGRSRITPAL